MVKDASEMIFEKIQHFHLVIAQEKSYAAVYNIENLFVLNKSLQYEQIRKQCDSILLSLNFTLKTSRIIKFSEHIRDRERQIYRCCEINKFLLKNYASFTNILDKLLRKVRNCIIHRTRGVQ